MPSKKPLPKVFLVGSGLANADTSGMHCDASAKTKWFVTTGRLTQRLETLKLILDFLYIPAFDNLEARAHVANCTYFCVAGTSIDAMRTTAEFYDYAKCMYAYFERGMKLTVGNPYDTKRMAACESIATAMMINQAIMTKLQRMVNSKHTVKFGDSEW